MSCHVAKRLLCRSLCIPALKNLLEDPFWTHCVAEFKNWNIDLDTLEAACETAAESFVKKIEKENKKK